nr:hypothetical protein [Clostridia bacterium]
ILGMKLAGVKFSKLFTSARMYYVSAIRLIIYPAITVGIMFALSFIPVLPVGADAVTAMFVALAMPTAGLASAFSDQYDGDTEHAVIFTLGTTILSVVTIPALYFVLGMIL